MARWRWKPRCARAGIQCGEEVIVPPITFVSTATCRLVCHGVPVFADIDPTTLNLSPAAVEKLITPRTRAIIAVHFGGHPADVDALTAIAEHHGLALIEDAAHAHGAAWRGIPVGNFGVAATFSFQAFKLATAGEGGAILTNSEALRGKGLGLLQPGPAQGAGWFEHFTLGSNYRLDGVSSRRTFRATEKASGAKPPARGERAVLSRADADLPRSHSRGRRPARKQPSSLHHYLALRPGGVRRRGARFVPARLASRRHFRPSQPILILCTAIRSFQSLPPCGCGKWSTPQDYQSLFLPESERVCKDGIWLEHSMFLGTHQDVDDIIAAFEKIQQRAGSLLPQREGSKGSQAMIRHRQLAIALLVLCTAVGADARPRPLPPGTPQQASDFTRWTFREDFSHGIPGWVSFPLSQDVGYDPFDLYKASGRLTRAGARHDLLRRAAPASRPGAAADVSRGPASSFRIGYGFEACGKIVVCISPWEPWMGGVTTIRSPSNPARTTCRWMAANCKSLPPARMLRRSFSRPKLPRLPWGRHSRLTLRALEIQAERPAERRCSRAQAGPLNH